MQHHEYGNDESYPQSIMKTKILPLARLLAVADHMAEMITHGMSQTEALKKMYSVFQKRFDHQYLDALAHALGADTKLIQALEKKAA